MQERRPPILLTPDASATLDSVMIMMIMVMWMMIISAFHPANPCCFHHPRLGDDPDAHEDDDHGCDCLPGIRQPSLLPPP